MFDVYVKETHPDMNFQPSTFEQRIELYREYQNKYDMTIPVLIDNMKNEWLNLYKPGPTGCVLIDKRGIVVYTIQFVMSANSYNTIDREVAKLVNEYEPYSYTNGSDYTPASEPLVVTRLNNSIISVAFPSNQVGSMKVYSILGRLVATQQGQGTMLFTPQPVLSKGRFLLKISTSNQKLTRIITLQ